MIHPYCFIPKCRFKLDITLAEEVCSHLSSLTFATYHMSQGISRENSSVFEHLLYHNIVWSSVENILQILI